MAARAGLTMFTLAAVLTLALVPFGTSSAAPTTMATHAKKHHNGMMMGSHKKPNMKMKVKQVAPAVMAKLMPAGAKGCNHSAHGSGSVRMIPVHVGGMSGPHVDLVVKLRGGMAMHQYGISGSFKGSHSWSGMAEADRTTMRGALNVMTRLMPMLRAGRYRARIMLHDMACGGAMSHPLAYASPWTQIQLR